MVAEVLIIESVEAKRASIWLRVGFVTFTSEKANVAEAPHVSMMLARMVKLEELGSCV
jgi:hypothetical protein